MANAETFGPGLENCAESICRILTTDVQARCLQCRLSKYMGRFYSKGSLVSNIAKVLRTSLSLLDDVQFQFGVALQVACLLYVLGF